MSVRVKIIKPNTEGIAGGDWCWLHSMQWPKNTRNLEIKFCVRCNVEIKPNDHIFLILNNWHLFPNCLVHSGCMTETWDAVKWLCDDWKKYNKFLQSNKGWK